MVSVPEFFRDAARIVDGSVIALACRHLLARLTVDACSGGLCQRLPDLCGAPHHGVGH